MFIDDSFVGETASVIQGQFVRFRCGALPGEAGGWFGLLTDAYLPGAATGEMVPETSYYGTLLAPYNAALAVAFANFALQAKQTAGEALLERILFENGVPSNSAITNGFDPMYLPGTAGGNIEQVLGLNAPPGWEVQDGTRNFSIQSILQEAVWHRVKASWPTKKSFFDSDTWGGMMEGGIEISAQLLKSVGPDMPPGVSLGQDPPLLEGWAEGNDEPLFDVARKRNIITFVGTHDPLGNQLWFSQPWSPPLNIIHLANPGSAVVFRATGLLPRMQVELFRDAQTKFVVDVFYHSLGKIVFRVPGAAPLGTYRVKRVHYFDQMVGGVPTYGPWQSIPFAYRPKIVVQ
ncbi:MAG: hypothetical protein AB8H80_02005 [Planctomycetota bacterium]